MIGSFGWMELLLILFIVLIIFGAGKIPQLGEGLGKAIKGFKKSIHEPDAMDVTPQDDAGMEAGAAPPAAGQPAPGAQPPPAPGQLAEPPVAQPVMPNIASQAGESAQQPAQPPPAQQQP